MRTAQDRKIHRIFDAFVTIAGAENNLVGFVNIVTREELEKTEQIFILYNQGNDAHPLYKDALELLRKELKGMKI